jgi:hypothetical protein
MATRTLIAVSVAHEQTKGDATEAESDRERVVIICEGSQQVGQRSDREG